jgi:hypothetical protein
MGFYISNRVHATGIITIQLVTVSYKFLDLPLGQFQRQRRDYADCTHLNPCVVLRDLVALNHLLAARCCGLDHLVPQFCSSPVFFFDKLPSHREPLIQCSTILLFFNPPPHQSFPHCS